MHMQWPWDSHAWWCARESTLSRSSIFCINVFLRHIYIVTLLLPWHRLEFQQSWTLEDWSVWQEYSGKSINTAQAWVHKSKPYCIVVGISIWHYDTAVRFQYGILIQHAAFLQDASCVEGNAVSKIREHVEQDVQACNAIAVHDIRVWPAVFPVASITEVRLLGMLWGALSSNPDSNASTD